MSQNKVLVGLDYGEKRIGLAVNDGLVRIARSLETIEVDGREIEKIAQILDELKADELVIGYPRNQSGEPTSQTKLVEHFVSRLRGAVHLPILYQDESLTSVVAEERLNASGKAYKKADIDALAAALILEDYMETAKK